MRMKNLHVISTLLATLLVVSSAVAQTSGGPASAELSDPTGIAAARTKYLEKTVDASATKDGIAQARLPRRGRGIPIPPHRGYNRGSYPIPWANSDPGHLLIGAGIGFAIGATIGAVAAGENGKSVGNAVLLGGPLFALFGAAIGASHSSGHPFIHRRRRYPVWPEEDEEGGLTSPAIEKNSQPVLSPLRKPAFPNQLRDAEAIGTTSPEMSSRPEQRSTAPTR